jgi:hypothetical protein
MKLNIPIFRAKKMDSDEYVEGCFNIWEQNGKVYHSIMDVFEFPSPYSNIHIIDITTLSINFPDMLDSNGNKIFASLSEDGKGGDIVTDGEYDFVVIFNGRSFNLMFVKDNTFIKFNGWENLIKFTKKGIQK